MTFLQRLDELARLVGAWRASRCSRPAVIKNGINWRTGDRCDGENHHHECDVQRALDDVIAAHNALGAPGMEK